MIRSRCCGHLLCATSLATLTRRADKAPVYRAKPRHHKLVSNSDQQAARSACISRAATLEAADASSATSALDVEPPADGPTARLVTVVPAEGLSHFGISWTRVMSQMARRLSWVDPAFQMQVCRRFLRLTLT